MLMVASGPFKGHHYEFTEKVMWTVGRAIDCSLQVPAGDANLAVSRHHCVFDIDPPDLVIRDLGSLNGTYVNGTKIGNRNMGVKTDDLTQNTGPATILHDGDVIRVGNTLFCVVVPEQNWDPEAPQEPTSAEQGQVPELAAFI